MGRSDARKKASESRRLPLRCLGQNIAQRAAWIYSTSQMANPQHLDIFNRGLQVWNAWHQQHPNEVPDLCEADLAGMDLNGAILFDAGLARADLKQTQLMGANLYLAALVKAHLAGADLRDADLGRAFLSEADLEGADLRAASLVRADL